MRTLLFPHDHYADPSVDPVTYDLLIDTAADLNPFLDTTTYPDLLVDTPIESVAPPRIAFF